ncbi:MAG: pyruvate kinase [Isosphaeraceae bacterium]|nr:pyruvate kinase [Isosphaeraceae bacterium]
MPSSRAPVEPLGKVRTKIVATVGPASRDRAILRAMIEAGVDVFRLNAAHGTHDEHTAAVEAIRKVTAEMGRVLGLLLDLGGPKLRLGPVAGGEIESQLGEEFILTSRPSGRDDPHELTCTYRELPRDLSPGDLVLFADGAVAMEVTQAGADSARLVVTQAGRLRSGQGVNLPDVDLRVKALTDKDLVDLDWAVTHGVEYVGLSFVRSAADVAWLRRELLARGGRAKIVAKIEKPQAVAELDAILAETDVVMVARGDLGVEMDVARVPAVQKQVIAACHKARVPVITATQMLNSMESSPQPTRAEASDVFNAVLDGTDALLLSGETAIGRFPVEAVAMMSRIAAEAERLLPAGRVELGPPPATKVGWIQPTTEAVVEAASLASRRLNAALLVVATHTGRTALALSKHRHPTPTLALADAPEVARAMSLYWGVTPVQVPDISDGARAMAFALDWARAQNLVARGDRVVLLRGTVPGNPVHNALFVQEVE